MQALTSGKMQDQIKIPFEAIGIGEAGGVDPDAAIGLLKELWEKIGSGPLTLALALGRPQECIWMQALSLWKLKEWVKMQPSALEKHQEQIQI